MASDIAVPVISGNSFYLGATVVACDIIGNRVILHGSGEQFTKTHIDDSYYYTKYDTRFDDVNYYTHSG